MRENTVGFWMLKKWTFFVSIKSQDVQEKIRKRFPFFWSLFSASLSNCLLILPAENPKL